MEIVGLKGLTVGSDATVRVRVCRMWESMNKKTNELISLEVLLVDEDKHVAWAQVKRHMVTRFRGLLSTGEVYTMSKFGVFPMTGEYRPVDAPVKLLFTLFTTVGCVKGSYPEIPMHGFQFVPQQAILSRVNNNTLLTDIVGCLTSVGNVETVSGGFRKRDLELMSDFSVTVKVTLWAEAADNFLTKYGIDKAENPVVIVFTSMRVKKYMEMLNFSATSGTHIYVNPSHEYVTSLLEVFAKVCPGLRVLTRGSGVPRSLEDEMFENRVTIERLLRAEWSAEQKGYKMTIFGSIDSIDTSAGWYFFSCQSCLKKVTVLHGSYTCTSCKTASTTPLILYKVHVVFRDRTGVVACVMLHRVAERVIDTSTMKLFNRADPESNEFPRDVMDLEGRSFVFKLSLTAFNLQKGSDVFTVCDVFEPVTHLEEKYAATMKYEDSQVTSDPSLHDNCVSQEHNLGTHTPCKDKDVVFTKTAANSFAGGNDEDTAGIGGKGRRRLKKIGEASRKRKLCVSDDEDTEGDEEADEGGST